MKVRPDALSKIITDIYEEKPNQNARWEVFIGGALSRNVCPTMIKFKALPRYKGVQKNGTNY
jgi:hypothetical protein